MGSSTRPAPRPLPWHREAWFETLQFLLLMGLLLWFVVQGAQGMGYEWKWDRVPRYLYRVIDGELIWGPLMKGAFVTLDIAWKAGLIGMSKALAYEVASRNITVNTVAPGFIGSAMTEELNDKQRESILTKVPAGRLGNAEEVAAAVIFLASNEAGYVTGHTLNVNGGMLML